MRPFFVFLLRLISGQMVLSSDKASSAVANGLKGTQYLIPATSIMTFWVV